MQDLSTATANSIRTLPLPTLARVALFCMRRTRSSPDFLAELRDWIAPLRELVSGDQTNEVRATLVSYMMATTDISCEELERFLVVDVDSHWENSMKTTADRLQEEGKAATLVEARAAARAKMAQLVKMQLSQRFDPLDQGVADRVHRASLERLETVGRSASDRRDDRRGDQLMDLPEPADRRGRPSPNYVAERHGEGRPIPGKNRPNSSPGTGPEP